MAFGMVFGKVLGIEITIDGVWGGDGDGGMVVGGLIGADWVG